MSQLALSEFHTHLLKLIDGRKTSDIVKDAREKLSKQIEVITPQLIDLGIANSIRSLRHRKASVIHTDGSDLFHGFELPVTSKLAKADSDGRSRSKRTEAMTKLEVRHKRDELAQLPRRQQKLLAEYTKLYREIDEYCKDNETVAQGLGRSREDQ